MQKKIKYAAFAGIIYLVSFLPELIFETLREYGHSDSSTSTLLMITYIISALSTIFFFYGFIIIGNTFNNNLLVVGSIIIILTTIFYYLYSWYTQDLLKMEEEIFGASGLILSLPAIIIEILLLLKAAELDNFKDNSINVA